MGDHRFRARRHWPVWFAAAAILAGLCGIAVNPLIGGHGPVGGNRAVQPPFVPAPLSSQSPTAPPSPAPSSPAPSTPARTGNLLASPGGDDVPGGVGDATKGIAGWTVLEGAPAVIRYGSDGFPGTASPGPADRGQNFFGGGTVALSRLGQTVQLPDHAGDARFNLAGLLGGYAEQGDSTTCTVTFVDASGKALSSVTLGPVTAADRGQRTGLFKRATTGTVPAGARTAEVELSFVRAAGTDNDGYADSLYLDVTPLSDGS
ncbi:hypothetical protein ACFO1B_18750 [Dactylosporangium siamense]|uniref:Uncharacterized protein n=1 Tax=Dactylosporangium siamense TaxID=685454 RepID=A0A919UAR5_9ACTN|nr:hypothetical protein [Dactylosporangium siamense]GIG43918.1 hypothetical protein Dsi01nite_019590 [Dactylosporangium siamense]